MSNLRIATLATVLAIVLTCLTPFGAAQAGSDDPLFINVTTDEGHRMSMALTFGGKQMKLGHPLTVFLNDRAVFAATSANAEKFAAQQKAIADLLASGATVIVCPMCMKHYGIDKETLLPGLTMGSPDVTGGALFKDNSKSLSW